MTQSAVSELAPDERKFLELVAPIGLDWLTTRVEFRQRHGHKSYAGLGEVIPLEPSAALSDSTLEFVMYDDHRALDLPPEYLWAYFMPHDNARQNHHDIEAQLNSRLGRPAIDDASNCIQRVWRFGVFSVRLSTFPPEIQPSELSRPGSNPYLDQNPRIRIAAKVSLHSEYALVYPDARLATAANAFNGSFWKPARFPCCVLASTARDGQISRYPRRRETLRNPGVLSNLINPVQLVAWKDSVATRLGLSAKRDSYLFEWRPTSHIVLVHLQPARGPGGYSLYFAPDDRSMLHQDAILLLDGELGGSLPTTANQLAETWQIPVRHMTVLDD
jgi:hypothetical protein